jgi:hypothetical protein
MGKLRWFVMGVMTGLTAAAVGQELAKPPEQRTWKGTVAGVPYNFRVNEWSDVATEYWNPKSDTILSPQAIGIGWGVNFAALARRAQAFVESQQQQQERDLPEPARR